MIVLGVGAVASGGGFLAWDRVTIKRFATVEGRRIARGAWPHPEALLRLIRRDSLRTVVTLTAINHDDPKYVAQDRVIQTCDTRWILIPMRGSTATTDQMAEAADLIADPANQPAFFHCVGGHHRSNLVHAAYLIRHKGFSADAAWDVVSRLPWSRPATDGPDRVRIDEFAARFGHVRPREDHGHDTEADSLDRARAGGGDPGSGPVRGGSLGDG